ncbi:MAG TPA: NAD(P)-binding domain-containing protein [Propionibacteriaceae bacterium]|nr:NAD(P)-binding domain-containing protein [Propionibacteriaceae bacterium]
MNSFDVVVVGAGQAGLSAAHALVTGGLDRERFSVLDANPGPGGAWRHRWPSLTLGAAHRVHPLPGLPLPEADPAEPASAVVARYFGEYERAFDLPVRRPVRVTAVTGTDLDEPLRLETTAGRFDALTLVNATGTWERPYWPYYPGRETFRGRQLHTHDFRSAEEFRGRHVVVVGAGTSAVQFLLQLDAAGATTTWLTRREPEFTRRAFDEEWGRDVEAAVNAITAAGRPSGSVVSYTKLPLTEAYEAGIASGVLVSQGPLAEIVPDGVLLADGRHVRADAILWATGFRPSLGHLAPLQLREPGGGIIVDGVRVAKDPRVFLVGYGASASTLGATRAGRQAARAALARVGEDLRGRAPARRAQ